MSDWYMGASPLQLAWRAQRKHGLKEWEQTFGGFAVRLFCNLGDLLVGDLQEHFGQQRLGQNHLQLDREREREGEREREKERERERKEVREKHSYTERKKNISTRERE